ncbi:MAG: SdpI family protein [Oscillospiraceae bacterium]|nr:SdpI family protein [Oscillospiraceae bacterium]
MGVWFFMLGCNLLLPVIMLIAGKLFLKNAPKKINSWVGYRTEMSMQNVDTWKFAHAVAGRFWWKWGWYLLPLSIIPILPLLGQTEEITATVGCILMCLQMIPLLAVIPHTEKALRSTFDKNGNRLPE